MEAKYINPYTGFGFKKLFNTEKNKELLISFVNSLLKGSEKVKSLTYLTTQRRSERNAAFDVYCENERGEKILIEMQRGEQLFFKEYSLYASFPFCEQGQNSEQDYRLKAVYVIGILNFTFDSDHSSYYHYKVLPTENHTKEPFYDKQTFIYLEMPKFNKHEEELDGLFDKWLFVLRNLSNLTERPKSLQERIFTKLFKVTEIAKLTVAEYEGYERSLKVYRDNRNIIDTAEMKALDKGRAEGREEGIEEGRKEGLKEGMEKGRTEEKQAIALKLKAAGLPVDSIIGFTGLSVEEIEEL